MKNPEKPTKKATVVISSAGMRPDEVRPDTGSPLPDRRSLLEEIQWRKEHQQ